MAWLNPKTEGVLSAPVETPETVIPANLTETPVTTYRVAIDGNKLTVRKVATRKSEAGTAPTLLFGVVSALSLAWLGLWLARARAK